METDGGWDRVFQDTLDSAAISLTVRRVGCIFDSLTGAVCRVAVSLRGLTRLVHSQDR